MCSCPTIEQLRGDPELAPDVTHTALEHVLGTLRTAGQKLKVPEAPESIAQVLGNATGEPLLFLALIHTLERHYGQRRQSQPGSGNRSDVGSHQAIAEARPGDNRF